jgi:hypothetical protein
LVFAYFFVLVDVALKIAGYSKGQVGGVFVGILQSFYIDLVRSVLGQLRSIKVDVDAGRSINCAVNIGILETNKRAGGAVSDHIAVRRR